MRAVKTEYFAVLIGLIGAPCDSVHLQSDWVCIWASGKKYAVCPADQMKICLILVLLFRNSYNLAWNNKKKTAITPASGGLGQKARRKNYYR